MIVEMMRYTFVVYHADYESFLQKLKDLGVVHIKETTQELSDGMQTLMRQIAEVRAIKQSLGIAPEGFVADNTLPTDGVALCEQIRQNGINLERAKQAVGAAEKDLLRYEPWGGSSFTTQTLGRFDGKGVEIRLFQCPQSQFSDEWTQNGAVIKVCERSGIVYFVAFGCDTMPLPKIEAEQVILPELSYSQIEQQRNEAVAQIAECQRLQSVFALYATPILNNYEALLTEELQECVARQSTSKAAEGSLRILEGYAPTDSCQQINEMLDSVGVVYLAAKATADECPPIKLDNSRFARLFEPITEMFSLPNYSELDPTPLFAPFFMLFFGLCLGDAGYGLLVLIAAILAKRKVGEQLKGYCSLGIILGAATVVVSLITGMFFGIDLSTVEFIPTNIRSLFVTDTNFKIAGYSPMMVVAVVIGLLQILFGMCVNAAKVTKQMGRKYAIATISWVVLLPVLGICFGLPSVGCALPMGVTYALYAIIAACGLGIFFFNSPGAGIVSNVGSGIWATYNMATGLLGDTLSYIRLFALGLTGGILGSVFNTMALQAGEGLPWYAKFIVVLLILLIGHAINFGLCIIGALVHPMRLTFVEFYKNAGFEGGGKEYNPFKKH